MLGYIPRQLVSVILGLLCLFQVKGDEYSEVVTSLGTIKGTRMTSYHGRPFYAFRGIRYAQPPVGELRFKVRVLLVEDIRRCN